MVRGCTLQAFKHCNMGMADQIKVRGKQICTPCPPWLCMQCRWTAMPRSDHTWGLYMGMCTSARPGHWHWMHRRRSLSGRKGRNFDSRLHQVAHRIQPCIGGRWALRPRDCSRGSWAHIADPRAGIGSQQTQLQHRWGRSPVRMPLPPKRDGSRPQACLRQGQAHCRSARQNSRHRAWLAMGISPRTGARQRSHRHRRTIRSARSQAGCMPGRCGCCSQHSGQAGRPHMCGTGGCKGCSVGRSRARLASLATGSWPAGAEPGIFGTYECGTWGCPAGRRSWHTWGRCKASCRCARLSTGWRE